MLTFKDTLLADLTTISHVSRARPTRRRNHGQPLDARVHELVLCCGGVCVQAAAELGKAQVPAGTFAGGGGGGSNHLPPWKKRWLTQVSGGMCTCASPACHTPGCPS